MNGARNSGSLSEVLSFLRRPIHYVLCRCTAKNQEAEDNRLEQLNL